MKGHYQRSNRLQSAYMTQTRPSSSMHSSRTMHMASQMQTSIICHGTGSHNMPPELPCTVERAQQLPSVSSSPRMGPNDARDGKCEPNPGATCKPSKWMRPLRTTDKRIRKRERMGRGHGRSSVPATRTEIVSSTASAQLGGATRELTLSPPLGKYERCVNRRELNC